jgi:hypothetical protein
VLALQTAVQLGDTSGANRLAELAEQVEGPRAPLAARYARALTGDYAAQSLDRLTSGSSGSAFSQVARRLRYQGEVCDVH